MMDRPMTDDELMACVCAGWPLRMLSRRESGWRSPGEPSDKVCDLWLGEYVATEHPDFRIGAALYTCLSRGLLVVFNRRAGVLEYYSAEACPDGCQTWKQWCAAHGV